MYLSRPINRPVNGMEKLTGFGVTWWSCELGFTTAVARGTINNMGQMELCSRHGRALGSGHGTFTPENLVLSDFDDVVPLHEIVENERPY